MLSSAFVGLCVDSTNNAVRYYGLPLEEAQEATNSLFNQEYGSNLPDCDLTVPEIFDAYSYSIFKVVSGHLPGTEKRQEFTQFIGEAIYRQIKSERDLEADGADDIPRIKNTLGQIMAFFVESGYVSSAEIDWTYFNEAVWKEKGESYFVYKMENAVILPSAKKLYREEHFGQHYSSRTLQAALRDFGIYGSEVDSFDPNKFNGCVKELWAVKKI